MDSLRLEIQERIRSAETMEEKEKALAEYQEFQRRQNAKEMERWKRAALWPGWPPDIEPPPPVLVQDNPFTPVSDPSTIKEVKVIITKPIEKQIFIERHASASTLEAAKKQQIPKHIKKLVWNEYIGAIYAEAKCVCCQRETIHITSFHCGHVIPESKGGAQTIENLRPICLHCNLAMGTTDMNEFCMRFFGRKV
jgi:hypothetical protein